MGLASWLNKFTLAENLGIELPGQSWYGDEYYADSVNGSDNNNGKSWTQSMATIAAAVALASAGDTIYIRGSFSEVVVVSLAGLKIIGCGTMPKETQWTSATDTISLTISANYVEVKNIYFRPPAYTAGVPAAIQIGGANHALIHFCRFQGKAASWNAIYSPVCNSDNVEISDCEFYYMNTATYGAAILGVEAGGLSYSGWKISRNTFSSCVIAVDICGRVCKIEGNKIMQYGINAANAVAAVCTTPLDLSGTGSGSNVVVGNVLAGNYSNTGGYTAAAAGDCWTGNFSNDAEEAEVDTSGITITIPAA